MTLETSLQLGSLLLDTRANQLVVDGEMIQVEPKLVELIEFLYSNQNQVVTRDALLENVWKGQIVSDNAVSRAISQVRKLLEQSSDPVPQIETIPRVGYRLNLEHDESPAASALPSKTTKRKRQIQLDKTFFKVITFVLVTVIIFGHYFYQLFSSPGEIDEVSVTSMTELPGVERKPRVSPDGKRVVFSYRPKDSDEYHLYLLDPESKQVTPLIEESQVIIDIAWSPDSKQILLSLWDNINQRKCTINLIQLAPDYQLKSNTKVLDCNQRGASYLAWHKSGDKFYFNDRLAFERPYAVYSYSLKSKRKSQITLPPQAGNLRGDYYVFSESNGERFAVLRYHASKSNELLIYDSASEKLVNRQMLEAGVQGISWFGQGDELLVRLKDKLYQYNFAKKEKQLLYPVGSGTADFFAESDQGVIYYSTGGSDVNLVAFPLAQPEVTQHVSRSTAVETRASWANLSNRLVFYSNRSGSMQIWLRGESGNDRQLSQSTKSLEASRLHFSPDDTKILFQNTDEIFILDASSGDITKIIDASHKAYVTSWSLDGKKVFYSAEKSGEWQIWQLDLDSNQHSQLTQEGGYSAFQFKTGDVYFSKLHEPGLWKISDKDLSGNLKNINPEMFLPDFDVLNWNQWQMTETGFYYVDHSASKKELHFYDLDNATKKKVLTYKPHYRTGFSIRDEQIVMTIVEDAETRIEKIELAERPAQKVKSYWSLFGD